MAVGLAVVLAPAAARADGADAALAEKLFQDGRAAMLAGDFATGCPKLAESQRLDPGVGTLLNLGECYEKQGRTASAWATYKEAEPAARRLGQKQRADHAAARAEALAATLPHLVLSVASQPRGLAVRVDGLPIAEAAWSTPIPVDPGERVVTASAPDHREWRASVQAKPGARVQVVVPALEPEPARGGATGPVEGPAPAAPPRTQRTLGWIGVGLGGAALATGLVFGVVAKSKNDEAYEGGRCTDVDCDGAGKALIGEAKDAALVSTILFAAGAAIATTGAVLVLTAPGGAKVAIGPAGVGGTW